MLNATSVALVPGEIETANLNSWKNVLLVCGGVFSAVEEFLYSMS